MNCLNKMRKNLDFYCSLVYSHFACPVADASCLDLVLRRKAITAEAQAVQRDAVLRGKYPDLEVQLEQWTTLRLQIARKTLAGPGPEGPQAHRRQLADWNSQRDRFESELAREIPEMNLEKKLRAADRRAVALALPEDITLVEFVRFDVFDFKALPAQGERQWQPARYLAFLLPARDPDNVRMIDLGEAEPLDRLIELFRAGVSEPPAVRNKVRRPAPPAPLSQEQAGQQLRVAVFDPLTAALGECRRLLLSPDGALTRLPFAVLPDAKGCPLVDNYQISYVNAGRDVLRFGAPSSGLPSAPVVVANPDFDLGEEGHASLSGSPSRVGSLREALRAYEPFKPLPGSAIEGETIAKQCGVQLLQGRDVLEARFREYCRSPRILHLATHGFWLDEAQRDPNEHSGFSNHGEMPWPVAPGVTNPLLRAGLALAGINTWVREGVLPPDAEDGLLTAEDVSGLDLLATELVVLSACETGLGEVRTGEGVFGLERAFTLAGTKTLVMSLWSVPDDATRELMQDFYTRILSGEGRADALRNAQRAMKAKSPDPYFWGAFVCQGDPGPLRDHVSSAASKA